MTEKFTHQPVMIDEVLKWLSPQIGDIIIDGTVGLAGHSLLLAEQIGVSGHLIGLDRDVNAINIAQEKLSAVNCRVTLLPRQFAQIDAVLRELNIAEVARILLDVGVSSMQFDDPTRGFSFRFDGALDMRMDNTSGISAQEIINQDSEENLADIFYHYGEERHSRKIARAIVTARASNAITTTNELANIIERVIPRRGKIHPATKVFQALRIVVNDELAQLEKVMPLALAALKSGGRLAIITFHSLEDRLVKYWFRQAVADKIAISPHKKAILPTYQATRENRRARSAKLRIIEKV